MARPEDHDMTDSDDEWNIEEKKIMLGMESSSHVADEGYRSVEKLIERISGVQNGAANRLSSLILEIDAMLQGIRHRANTYKNTLLPYRKPYNR